MRRLSFWEVYTNRQSHLTESCSHSSSTELIAITFSILYTNAGIVQDTEQYEISIIKATASASEADLKKIRC